jgi:hypothetical protein
LIPEEMITKLIDSLLDSEPGDAISRLYVVSAPTSAFGPLSLADEAKLETTVVAIVPTADIDAEAFVVRAIYGTHARHLADDRRILFAALAQEVWTVRREAPRGTPAFVQAPKSLQDEPDVQEATLVYAVCRDGRRWRARHDLTGPDAGPARDVQLLVGRPDAQEAFGGAWGKAMRRIVGQKF